MKTIRLIYHTLLLSVAAIPTYFTLYGGMVEERTAVICIGSCIIYTLVNNLRNLVNTITGGQA